MKYINAQNILPKELIQKIQNYIEGGYLYIPTSGSKKAWGEMSGHKRHLAIRNQEIRDLARCGMTVKQLSETYYLSESSIRKILKSSNT
ncbi:MAG: CD3324 family protein [Cellulosilyticaceae bacterium]